MEYNFFQTFCSQIYRVGEDIKNDGVGKWSKIDQIYGRGGLLGLVFVHESGPHGFFLQLFLWFVSFISA